MILGYLLAVLATVASGSGSILESIGVRRAGAFGGRSADLVGLLRQPVYFLGIGVDLLGFVLAAAALHRLPLFLVQALLAFSVGVTATISAFLGARIAWPGWAALGLGAGGLVLLGVSAQPSPATALPGGWRFALLGMPLVVAAIGWNAKNRRGPWTAQQLAFAAGLGFCMVGVSARTLVPPDPAWHLVAEPAGWAMVLNGGVAAVCFAMSLQRSGATSVTAVMFTTNTALASFIGVTLLDDRVRPGFAAAAITGFVCSIVGAVGAAHYAHLVPAGGSFRSTR